MYLARSYEKEKMISRQTYAYNVWDFFLKNPLTAIAVDIPFGFYTLLTHVDNLLDHSL